MKMGKVISLKKTRKQLFIALKEHWLREENKIRGKVIKTLFQIKSGA